MIDCKIKSTGVINITHSKYDYSPLKIKIKATELVDFSLGEFLVLRA